ncbi:MAG: cobalamin biosynthesis protein CbiE, partial [Chloroflexi bacterium]|nr:cobalamin biosynthesis protein CbiE [Chloroflexota bacterium]
MPSKSASDHRVLVVGVGDDGPAGLSPAILARVAQAQLMVGGHRHLDLFPEVSAERLAIVGSLDEVITQIDRATVHQRVVVL